MEWVRLLHEADSITSNLLSLKSERNKKVVNQETCLDLNTQDLVNSFINAWV